MDEEEAQFPLQGMSPIHGLGERPLCRDHYVAQEVERPLDPLALSHGEGQDISGSRHFTEGAIELSDSLIIDHQYPALGRFIPRVF